MALELECNLVRKLEPVSGTSARGPWSKQEFIVQYQDGNFPNQVVLNVWGEDKVRDLGQYQPGDRIKASLTPSSREFNGRWYTDVNVYMVRPVDAAAPAAAAAPSAQQPSFQPAPAPQFGAPEEDNSDDRPF